MSWVRNIASLNFIGVSCKLAYVTLHFKVLMPWDFELIVDNLVVQLLVSCFVLDAEIKSARRFLKRLVVIFNSVSYVVVTSLYLI